MSATRTLIKRITPPIIVDWLRPTTTETDSPIWSGVYPDLESVPRSGEGFDGETWLKGMTDATSAAISAAGRADPLPTGVPTFRAMLGMLVSIIGRSKDSIRILDFGGGMGIAFANLMSTTPHVKSISCVVVDNPESCRRGEMLFRGDPRVQFSSTLPQDLQGFDVCFLGSVLQYISDYRGLLARLAAGHPEYVFLAFTPVGNVPTFATAQRNVVDSIIPIWFFNLAELTRELDGLGYELLFQSAFCERTFDMSNFPETHRLKHMSTLLFGRKTA